MLRLKTPRDFHRETTLAILSHTHRYATNRTARCFDWFTLLAVSGYVIVALTVALCIKCSNATDPTVWYVEPVLTLCLQYHKPLLFTMLMSTSILFHLYRLIHHRPLYRFYMGRLLHDLLVKNYDHFHRSLLAHSETKVKKRWRSSYLTVLHTSMHYWWQLVYKGQHFDWNQFAQLTLASLPRLSTKFRFQLALLQRTVRSGILLFQTISCLIFTGFAYQTVPVLYRMYPYWCETWWITIPLSVMFYMAILFQTIFFARLLLYIPVVNLFAIVDQLKVVNERIGQIGSLVRRANLLGRRVSNVRPVGQLLYYHLIGCRQVIQINDEIYSKAFCLLLLHDLPYNAVVIANLISGQVQGDEFWLLVIMMVTQLGSIPLVLFLPGLLHKTLHQAKGHLLPIQLAVQQSVALKVKLDAHYDRLVNKSRYGLTIGSLGLITYWYILEMLLSHIAIVIFVLARDFN